MQRAFAVLVLVVFVGCGGGAPSEVVPADATLYLGMSADRSEVLLSGTSREDFDFDRDVRPWLGERAAYFKRAAQDEYGLVFDSEDDERAEEFGREVATGGPLRASAVIDGHLVLASSREVLRAASAAAGGEALADSIRLDVAGEDSDEPPDFLVAAEEPRDVPAAFELMKELGDGDSIPVEWLGDGPLSARLWEDPRRIEVTGLPTRPDVAPSLADVPGAAWLAVASADLGEDAALARAHEQFGQIEQLTGIDLEQAVLPHLGAGLFFVQGRTPADLGGRLVAETADEAALRREATAWAKRLGPKRAEIHQSDEFFELTVDHPDLPHLFLEIRDGRLQLDGGVAAGGVAEDLDDTRAYRDAERRLGGAPTFLLLSGDRYLAARDGSRDGRRVVSVHQRG